MLTSTNAAISLHDDPADSDISIWLQFGLAWLSAILSKLNGLVKNGTIEFIFSSMYCTYNLYHRLYVEYYLFRSQRDAWFETNLRMRMIQIWWKGTLILNSTRKVNLSDPRMTLKHRLAIWKMADCSRLLFCSILSLIDSFNRISWACLCFQPFFCVRIFWLSFVTYCQTVIQMI